MIISQIFCQTSDYDQGGLITTKFAQFCKSQVRGTAGGGGGWSATL